MPNSNEVHYTPTKRKFFTHPSIKEVNLGTADNLSSNSYVINTVPLSRSTSIDPRENYDNFFESLQFQLYDSIANKGLSREETHLVTPIAFEKSEDGQNIRLFLPSIEGPTLTKDIYSPHKEQVGFRGSLYDLETISQFIQNIGHALSYLHDTEGILHNDLGNIDNIVLSENSEGKTEFYLLDFGRVSPIGDTFDAAVESGNYPNSEYSEKTSRERQDFCSHIQALLLSGSQKEIAKVPYLEQRQKEKDLFVELYGTRIVELMNEFCLGTRPMTFDQFSEECVDSLNAEPA